MRFGERLRHVWFGHRAALTYLGCVALAQADLCIAETSPAAQIAQTPSANSTDPAALRGHVEFLADDLLEGRGTASRGHSLAAAYVVSLFRQWGIAPFGDEGEGRSAQRSYLQTVRLLEATPVLPGSSAKFTHEGTTTFEYGTDFLPSADFGSPNATTTAPLAFVGFGVTAPELDYDDYGNVDVRDRIVVMLSGAPASFPRDQRAYYASAHEKYRNLAQRGAIGIITIDTPADTERTPWERRVKMSWLPQMRWLGADGLPSDAFLEIKQRFRFNHAAAAKLFAGSSHTLEQVFATAEASQTQSFLMPGSITLATTTGLRRTDSPNVVGIIQGSDPQLRRQYIVISAHLDHLGRGATVNGDAIYNGAQDNALGIAVMLETARTIANSKSRPKRSIIFLATTAEEKGLLGADYFAANALDNRLRIVANINIDMPFMLAPTRDLVAIGAEHSTLGALAARAVQANGYALSRDREPQEGFFIRSDHYAFVRRGIPALHLGSGYVARNRQNNLIEMRKEFMREHYHQPSDDLSLPIYYPGAADLVKINAELVAALADRPDPPYWHRGDFFGTKFVQRP